MRWKFFRTSRLCVLPGHGVPAGYLALYVSATVVLSLIAVLPAFCQKPASCEKASSEEAQILALKKKLVDQDRRINQLEKQVKALLGLHETVPGHVTGQTSQPSQNAAEPDSSVGASSTAAPEGKGSTPAGATSTAGHESTATMGKRVSSFLAPIHFGGNVYLYQYVPFAVSGAHPKFELYAFSALLDGQKGPWGFHADYRFRTTKLRSFYPGNTWLQQGYVRYRTRWGEVKVGSFYRRVGLEWDDSFVGNIEYFDGFMLDPEFGVGFEGSHRLSGRLGAEYSLQYFSTNAPVNGPFPGRDFVSEAGARAKNDVTMRFAPVWHFNKWSSLTAGGSFAQGTIDRDNGPHNQRRQIAADASLQLGPLLTYGEVLRQSVNGVVVLPPQNATYTLAGIRWTRGRYQPRFNFSQGNYHAINGRREYIVQPGITVRLSGNLSLIYEFNFWRQLSVMKPATLDRSVNLVLLYHF